MLDTLLNVAEASDLTRLKESTIRRWILEKKIAYVKLGRRVFIRRSDIELLISESFIPAQKRTPTALPSRQKKVVTHAA